MNHRLVVPCLKYDYLKSVADTDMFLIFLIGMLCGIYIDQELEAMPKLKPIIVNFFSQQDESQESSNKET